MIKTKKQAIKAVKEIQRHTGWTLSRVATEAGIHRATIVRLMGETPNEPNEDTRKKLCLLQMASRSMK